MFSYLDPFTKIYLLLLCAVLGLVMGSALNCLAFRMAHQQKWTGGRSRCVRCGHELKWNDLVPVFSYLFLKGRCRYCGEKISPRYFLAELTLGIVFPALLLRYDLSLDFAVMAVLFGCLFCLSLVDLDTFEIPNRFLVIPGVLRLSQLLYSYGLSAPFLKQVLPAAGILIGLLALVLVMDKVLGKESMGGGDIKLLSLLALFFSFPEWLLLLLVSCILGLVLAATLGAKKGIAFPFGPAISAAAFLVSLFGSQIAGWYLSLF